MQIFDKRQVIKGIKKMKHEFKVQRRKLLKENNEASYSKIVILYKKAIEAKLESNLSLIAVKVTFLFTLTHSTIKITLLNI